MGQANRHTTFELVAAQPWAIQPDMLETIAAIARRENESPEAVAAKLGRPLQNTRTVAVRDGVAVVPITGPIMRYANLFTEISGATSLEILARDFNAAINDSTIKAIVLEIDSPGGQAAGISEFAQMVRAANKPVVAYVGDIAASAAYWIASAADEIVVSKTGMVGSIGAVVAIDTRRTPGVLEIVSNQSPRKRVDIATDEGRAQIQARIDALAQVFIDDVANYRGISAKDVMSNFGQGDTRMGAEAVALGMADRLSTLEDVIGQLANSKQTSNEEKKMFSNHNPQAMTALPLEDRCRAKWNTDAALRAEFGNNFDTYAAYERAVDRGNVRKHSGRGLAKFRSTNNEGGYSDV